ncbi:MAG: ribosome maturation factor RimM [Myxococcota bacterium]|nr:ribosome maturation factor RimM [Myxococcota bacterium]
MAPLEPHLQVGYVNRAHGLTGEVGVKLFDPGSEALHEVRRVLIKPKGGGAPQTLIIESVRETPKEVLLVFQGVRGRSASERLVGSAVLVFREDLTAPAENEFFQGDLIGLAAFDEAGNALGTLEEIWETGPVPNLVIRKEGGGELVVPFADDFVVSVDVAAGRLVVKPYELDE